MHQLFDYVRLASGLIFHEYFISMGIDTIQFNT